jgi:hypothetical protein
MRIQRYLCFSPIVEIKLTKDYKPLHILFPGGSIIVPQMWYRRPSVYRPGSKSGCFHFYQLLDEFHF